MKERSNEGTKQWRNEGMKERSNEGRSSFKTVMSTSRAIIYTASCFRHLGRGRMSDQSFFNRPGGVRFKYGRKTFIYYEGVTRWTIITIYLVYCTRTVYTVLYILYCIYCTVYTVLYTSIVSGSLCFFLLTLPPVVFYNGHGVQQGLQGESLPLERLWQPTVAKPYVVFAYFKFTYEPNLVKNMAQKAAFRNSSK